ncbi:MAG TPA: sodium:solute symporter family protein [Chloroflexota bacterium]|nr:sodium:solute symporter family protein [Chloroflexota bacterium]
MADSVADTRSVKLSRAEWRAWEWKLYKGYGLFTLFLLAFIAIIMFLELNAGLPRGVIAGLFIVLSFALYGVIGIVNFTRKFDEYYVAGRKVPAFFNGMATGADWMSAASFISMAGTIWMLGYDALAYIMGWTGGYVILALFFAPYIRKFGQFTIPDFVAARFAEKAGTARLIAAICAILASFTYVTAQVVGVGLIMSWFFGVDYNWGVFLGLAGVVLCSFLGGMKSITWTQVAQYIILIVAYLIPVSMLSARFTGVPISELMYGQALQNITQLEQAQGLATQYVQPFTTALSNASWRTSLQGLGIEPPELVTNRDWVGTPWQFMALTLCLMLGTVGLPHILIRYYTVPNPQAARMSVGWSLFFIYLLYFTAPAYAAFARWEMLQNLVGQPIASLPGWVQSWGQTGLLTIRDANSDGILQFPELSIVADLIVLSTPEIAGLPYTVSALVAAGGLAAALSTADGLLMVIATAVSHDIYAKLINPNASYGTRFMISRVMILVGALLAALAAIPRLALIAQMVAWAFSMAASSFFPVMLLGIFWRRANAAGAIAGMAGGMITCILYMALNYTNPYFTILGLSHLSAGIFGMIVNFALQIIVSLATAPPPPEIQRMVDDLRIPVGEMYEDEEGGVAPGLTRTAQA